MNAKEPRYQIVKRTVLDGIQSGRWPAGARVPSENELVEICSVSRMTARRALDELTKEGVLTRIQGLGSFVSSGKHQSSVLEIRNIAAEIEQRGHSHSSEILLLQQEQVSSDIGLHLSLGAGQPVFHSLLLHKENGLPIQLEDRYVNPRRVPDYLKQEFSRKTPNEYLSSVAPVTEAEHIIEAVMPDAFLADRLQLDDHEAVLKLQRTTWCGDQPVSYALLYHPGKRYRLSSRFSP